MTFGRWLLIHSFSIFIVVMLLLGYVYRDELQLQQAYNQLLNLKQPEELIKTFNQKKNVQVENENKTGQTNNISANTDDHADKTLQVIPPARQNPLPVTRPSLQVQPGNNDAVQASTPDNLLYDARQAFWDKDYQTAIEGYQRLIDQYPQNADYSGELGNIYYVLNDYNNAAELYYRTAQLLLQKGDRDAARQLLSPINAMNRELGDKLKQKLNQK
jgi:TolA-binding protein